MFPTVPLRLSHSPLPTEGYIIALVHFRFYDHDGGHYALYNLGSLPWSALFGILDMAVYWGPSQNWISVATRTMG